MEISLLDINIFNYSDEVNQEYGFYHLYKDKFLIDYYGKEFVEYLASIMKETFDDTYKYEKPNSFIVSLKKLPLIGDFIFINNDDKTFKYEFSYPYPVYLNGERISSGESFTFNAIGSKLFKSNIQYDGYSVLNFKDEEDLIKKISLIYGYALIPVEKKGIIFEKKDTELFVPNIKEIKNPPKEFDNTEYLSYRILQKNLLARTLSDKILSEEEVEEILNLYKNDAIKSKNDNQSYTIPIEYAYTYDETMRAKNNIEYWIAENKHHKEIYMRIQIIMHSLFSFDENKRNMSIIINTILDLLIMIYDQLNYTKNQLKKKFKGADFDEEIRIKQDLSIYACLFYIYESKKFHIKLRRGKGIQAFLDDIKKNVSPKDLSKVFYDTIVELEDKIYIERSLDMESTFEDVKELFIQSIKKFGSPPHIKKIYDDFMLYQTDFHIRDRVVVDYTRHYGVYRHYNDKYFVVHYFPHDTQSDKMELFYRYFKYGCPEAIFHEGDPCKFCGITSDQIGHDVKYYEKYKDKLTLQEKIQIHKTLSPRYPHPIEKVTPKISLFKSNFNGVNKVKFLLVKYFKQSHDYFDINIRGDPVLLYNYLMYELEKRAGPKFLKKKKRKHEIKEKEGPMEGEFIPDIDPHLLDNELDWGDKVYEDNDIDYDGASDAEDIDLLGA